MEPRCRRVPTARGRPRRAAGTHEPSGCGGAARGVTPTGCAALGWLGRAASLGTVGLQGHAQRHAARPARRAQRPACGRQPRGAWAAAGLGPRGAGHTSRRCGPGRGRAARPPPVPRTARGWPTPPRAPRCRPGRGATRPGPGAPWAPGAWGGGAGDGGRRSPTQPPKRWPSAGRLATRRGAVGAAPRPTRACVLSGSRAPGRGGRRRTGITWSHGAVPRRTAPWLRGLYGTNSGYGKCQNDRMLPVGVANRTSVDS